MRKYEHIDLNKAKQNTKPFLTWNLSIKERKGGNGWRLSAYSKGQTCGQRGECLSVYGNCIIYKMQMKRWSGKDYVWAQIKAYLSLYINDLLCWATVVHTSYPSTQWLDRSSQISRVLDHPKLQSFRQQSLHRGTLPQQTNKQAGLLWCGFLRDHLVYLNCNLGVREEWDHWKEGKWTGMLEAWCCEGTWRNQHTLGVVYNKHTVGFALRKFQTELK